MEFVHKPVLFEQCMEILDIKKDGIYVDGTMGGGGHSEGICQRLDGGRLIGIDRDREAIAAATKLLESFAHKLSVANCNYSEIKTVLNTFDISSINGALLDLGVSSYQLDNPDRGFGYMHDAPLDMRMSRDDVISARDIVNTYSEKQLTEIISNYGEEKWAVRIAKFIVEKRSEKPIETTFELNDVIKAAVPKNARRDGPHPSKRTFQAIRIEVNHELDKLRGALLDFFDVLAPGGVLAVITFHSLEDRITKETFASLTKGCTCPKEFPVCVCGNTPKGKLKNKKPIIADGVELEENPRSRSAKLRAIIKL